MLSPKACPYVMMRLSIVDDISHRICEGKRNSGLFLFTFSDNLISEDWFFAEGERFLPFWRYHYRPSPRLILCAHCYHQATRPCTQGRLHGVSHHLASPMPVPAVVSVSPWIFLCGIISVAIFFVGECDFFVGKIWK